MGISGLVIIISALVFTAWRLTTRKANKPVIGLCLIAVFAGLVLTFQGRITELTIKGIGSIKAATVQAETKLAEIEQIRKQVEAQSATIDLVAKDANATKQLTEDIKKKSDETEQKVKAIDLALAKANSQIREFDSLLEFMKTVVAAQNDDRPAFDQLKSWADNAAYPYSKESTQAWTKIFDEHSQPIMFGGLTIPWNEGFDPAKLNINGLRQQYAGAPPQMRPAFLEYIWGRKDIPKIIRMDFLMEVMRHDPSLKAVEYAGRYFTSGASLKMKPLAVEYLYDWWQKNRNTIKE